jgi:hypothetical protein
MAVLACLEASKANPKTRWGSREEFEYMIRRVLFLGTILSGLVTGLSASALSGTFDMSGIITVSSSTISWTSDLSPFLPEMFSLTTGTGAFASEVGQNGISDLDSSSEPIGTTFVNTPFINFDVVPAPSLLLNFISAGVDSSADCFAPAAANQTCTPPNPGGSPFNLQNLSSSQSTASFALSGVTADGLSNWTGIFTVPFNDEPFQQVLATLNSAGSVTNSFSAEVTVTPVSTTPEPTPAFMLACGLGLLAVSFGTKRLVKN